MHNPDVRRTRPTALEPGETALWTGTATLAAETAQAAGGREQFKTLWKSDEKAAVTLTNQRLVYDIRKFTGARARRSGRTAAGQIRHENLANLITGENARTTFAGPATVTATLIEPPKRMIRIHLIVDSTAEEIARRWIQAAATERLQRLTGSLNDLRSGQTRRAARAAARPEAASRLLETSFLGSTVDIAIEAKIFPMPRPASRAAAGPLNAGPGYRHGVGNAPGCRARQSSNETSCVILRIAATKIDFLVNGRLHLH